MPQILSTPFIPESLNSLDPSLSLYSSNVLHSLDSLNSLHSEGFGQNQGWGQGQVDKGATFTCLDSLKFLKSPQACIFLKLSRSFKSLATARAKVGAGPYASNSFDSFILEFSNSLNPCIF